MLFAKWFNENKHKVTKMAIWIYVVTCPFNSLYSKPTLSDPPQSISLEMSKICNHLHFKIPINLILFWTPFLINSTESCLAHISYLLAIGIFVWCDLQPNFLTERLFQSMVDILGNTTPAISEYGESLRKVLTALARMAFSNKFSMTF